MKILYVTTVGVTMGFFPPHIRMLLQKGHTVELACNDKESPIPAVYGSWGLKTHTVPFSRSPLRVSHIRSYHRIKKLIRNGDYDMVHTHTPIASVLVRFACRKQRKSGLQVVYTAHGFHFYQGAPLFHRWAYYPIEKWCSRWTDALITVNREDYDRARQYMDAGATYLVPGVGVDLSRFAHVSLDCAAKKRELGIPENAEVLIYVAELNKNKNQSSLLDMMAEVAKTQIHAVLLLVGEGPMLNALKKKAERLHLGERVIFAGFRQDVPELLRISDVCVPSSVREGLPVNVIEAMASLVPVVAYDNRGHRTLIQDGRTGYIVPSGDHRAMAARVLELLKDPSLRCSLAAAAAQHAANYSVEKAVAAMEKIYDTVEVNR